MNNTPLTPDTSAPLNPAPLNPADFPSNRKRIAKQALSNLRNHDRDVKQLAASVMGLSYGPSECRREDADEYLAVKISAGGQAAQSVLFDSHQVIPVCYVYTRNRDILETPART